MEERTLKSWEEFEQALAEIDNETKRLQGQASSNVSYPLFRGVGDSKYHLESTLDRIKKEMKLSGYITKVKIAREYVATCIGTKWDLNKKIFCEKDLELPAYEFMAYLRHNGFPSPLTDWTKSPYIAAFFAFRDINSEAEHVSIFFYREYCGNAKEWSGNEPRIHTIGPSIKTARTHFLQQSEYLFCVKPNSENEWIFADYEQVPPYKDQNIMTKYNIPGSERKEVLKKLDSMNITAYSLFGSEPSLMETLALREICF
ncbi:MAG TPA: FRG domain-containing protein [Planctomycetes bacterium]|nr:FRG domain-containing protein [Planctomycetota bacterium]